MKNNNTTSFLGCFLFTCLIGSGCGGQSVVNEVTALLPPQPTRTLSPEVAEIFTIAERMLAPSNDDTNRAPSSRFDDWRSRLNQVKARYGDTKGIAEVYERQFRELNAQKLDSDEKDQAYLVLVMQMNQVGLIPDAIRTVERSRSPTIRAFAPFMLGQLQLGAERLEDARKSFSQSLNILRTAPESEMRGTLVSMIIASASAVELVSPNDSMSDLIVAAEALLTEKSRQGILYPGTVSARARIERHRDNLAAGNYEPLLRQAEAENNREAKGEYVRALIREQMRRGDFDEVPKTIDRIVPPDGRDSFLRSWAIGLTQHGKLAEAMLVADSIKELQQRGYTIENMIGVLLGKGNRARIIHGLLPESSSMPEALVVALGGDVGDADIPPPEYSDEELLVFCRWYATKADTRPISLRGQTASASAAALMERFGFTEEAGELFEKALKESQELYQKDWGYAVTPIIRHRIDTGDYDAAMKLIELLTESEVNISVGMKIDWLCEMGKLDEAIALMEENLPRWALLRSEIGAALIAVDRIEEGRKMFEQAIEHDLSSDSHNPDLVRRLLQADMMDEALRFAEQINSTAFRASAFREIATKQWQDDNIADAEKTLLKAAKAAEILNTESRGANGINELQLILSVLMLPKDGESMPLLPF